MQRIQILFPVLNILTSVFISHCVLSPSWAEPTTVIKQPLPKSIPVYSPALKFETISLGNRDEIVHHEDRMGFLAKIRGSEISYYGAGVDRISGRAPWIHYSGYRALGTMDWHPKTDWMLSIFAGASQLTLHHFLNRTYELSRSLPMWKLRGIYTPWSGTDFRVEGSNDFTYMGWLDRTDTQGQLIAVQNSFAEVESSALPGWRMRSNARVSFLEDSNRQQAFDHQILREVLTDPFVFSAGIGGGWMRYQEQWPGYWNPAYFEYYGLRVVAAKDLSEAWNIEARYNYGFHREIHRLRGEENAGELHLRYHTPTNWVVNLHGSFLDSEDGSWWRNDVSLYLEIPL